MQLICLKSAWALLVVCLWPSVSCLDLSNKTDEIIYDDSKIVGGLPANPKQFPFICRLLIGRGGQGRSLCAGSIISKRCLVTAAHCVSRRPSSVKAQCGFLDFKNPTGEEFEAEADMGTLLVHAQYGRNNRNDIALLCLPPGNEFPVTDHIQAVRVTDRTEYPTGSVITCGWGTTSEGGSVSSMLRYVEVPMHNPDTCSSTLGSGFEHSSMICAGEMEGGKDSCQGDSGGPLIDSVTKHLVGIVSWGFGCARPNQPGVYTRVGMYTDWIFNSIKNIEA